MKEIRFYHLTRSRPFEALPDLLEKIIAKGWRAVVCLNDADEVEKLNEYLWTYKSDSFLPHGSAKNGHAENQPIWLTDKVENPNGAEVLLRTCDDDGCEQAHFNLVCYLFDGNDSESLEKARAQWLNYKGRGLSLTYWQQEEKGWTNKTE